MGVGPRGAGGAARSARGCERAGSVGSAGAALARRAAGVPQGRPRGRGRPLELGSAGRPGPRARAPLRPERTGEGAARHRALGPARGCCVRIPTFPGAPMASVLSTRNPAAAPSPTAASAAARTTPPLCSAHPPRLGRLRMRGPLQPARPLSQQKPFPPAAQCACDSAGGWVAGCARGGAGRGGAGWARGARAIPRPRPQPAALLDPPIPCLPWPLETRCAPLSCLPACPLTRPAPSGSAMPSAPLRSTAPGPQ